MIARALAWPLMLLAAVASEPASAGTNNDTAVRSALGRGDYPWYDAKADAIKPLTPPAPVEEPATREIVGPVRTIVFAIMAAALAALIAALAWAWARYGRGPDDLLEGGKSPTGTAARTTSLPAGLQVDLTDPWGEAVRLRAQGDFAGAIVCLFVHQLLTLDRLGQTRLAPGRTARQLVRAVADDAARRRVEPTLRLFEAVIYGHQPPSVEAFEAAWSEAEAFQRWAAAGVAS
jgi:hypothetical protein